MLDLENVPTLGALIWEAFARVAPREGVELKYLGDDANDWSIFWQKVAKELLARARPNLRGPGRGLPGGTP